VTKLRIGVIGLGIGRSHIRGYQSHPTAEVVAIADLDETRLKVSGDEYKIPHRYRDAQEMLAKEKLDIVSIATPNKFHKPLTLAALAAGCHVLGEKPMAMNAAEGREMLAAAKRAGKRLMINFSYRFMPSSWALKTQVDAGALGDIYFARTIWLRRRGLPGLGGWFGQKDLAGGGPIIDLGVHRLDLALWLMGYPKPGWVLASTYDAIGVRVAKQKGVKFDVEDFGVALIKFQNGATLELEASWASHIAEQELMETRLLGTIGGAVQHNVGEGYKFESELFVERDGMHYDMKLHYPPGREVPNQFHHFVDCILHDKPHIATGEEGLIVMELLDAIYESAASGRPVQIKD
jgi:predicted dehydrogenase